MVVNGYEDYLRIALKCMMEYEKEISLILNKFKLQNEYEVYSGNFVGLRLNMNEKKVNLERLQELVFIQLSEIKTRFSRLLRQECLNNEILELSNKKVELKKIASATYIAAYYRSDCGNEEIKAWMNNLRKLNPNLSFYRDGGANMFGLPWLIFSNELAEN